MFRSPRAVNSLDSQFWVYHLWLPLLLVIPVFYMFEHTSLDMSLANFLYQAEGGDWVLRKGWFTYDVMHRGGKRLIVAAGLVLLALYAASWKFERLRQWRWSMAVSCLGMIVLPATVAFLKHHNASPCPWSVNQFGGSLAYLHSLRFSMAPPTGHCLPASHSSGGFGLLAIYVAFSPFMTRRRYWLLLPGLVTGIAFGVAQQLRGAHFISHDVWSLAICWFGALLLLKLAWRFRTAGRRHFAPETLTDTDHTIPAVQLDQVC